MSAALSKMNTRASPAKLQLIRDHFRGDSCLDIGCGAGLYGHAAARRGARVLQLDVQDRRLPEARGLPFRQVDASVSLQVEGDFDTVFAFDIMEHLDDDRAFLSQVRAVCGQRLLLSVPNEDDSALQPLGFTYKHHLDKTHRRAYERDQLLALLEECGFRVSAVVPNVTRGLLHAPRALSTGSLPSRLAVRLLLLQLRWLERAGLLRNPAVGDWLVAAEPG